MSKRQHEKNKNSRRNGFGQNLYRNADRKIIGGVCSGIADHFEIDHNIMRIIFIAALVFTGPVAFWSYVIAWMVLVPKRHADESDEQDREHNYEYDEREHCRRKKNMFRYRDSASVRLQRANKRLQSTLERVDSMERYVTSRKFDLNRQFSELEK